MSEDLVLVVSNLDSELARRAAEAGTRTEVLERSLADVVRGAGWKKRTPDRMRRLRDELRSRGILSSADLTDLAVPLHSVVRFSRVPDHGPPPVRGPSPAKARVFLSYARRDASKLADRLFTEMVTRGVDPWKDTHEIRSGSEWERTIKAGIRGSEAMVAVLSPESVRTTSTSPIAGDTDSVCLDEIAYARYRSPPTPIVPVMGKKCEPPLSIFRLDYVDLTEWMDPEFDWDHGLDRLLAGLEAARGGQELFRSASSVLKPSDFGAFLASKRLNFFGRQWLFDSILKGLESSGSMLVIGDPGVGKTAAMAEMVHRNFGGRIDAYHFCRADRTSTLRPGVFVRSIAAMLASRHPPYAERLESGELWNVLREAESDADPRTALEAGILDPLNEIEAPDAGYRILVVDSLDEALRLDRDGSGADGHGNGPTIVEVLEGHLSLFPPWLKLLATTRNEPEVIDPLLAALSAKRLEAGGKENLDDLRQYIERRAASGFLRDKVLRAERSGLDVVHEICEAARGNFLYAAQALDALESGRLGIGAVRKLPEGLAWQYRSFFARRYRSRVGFKRVRSVLECLVAGLAPVPEADLALATGLDPEYELPELLEELSEFLRTMETESGERRFSVFHKSLSDWLADPKRKGKAFRASAWSGHRQLADALWAVYESRPSELSDYGLTHLSDHLSTLVRGRPGTPGEREDARRLVRFVLDDHVQDLRAGDPQGIRRSITGALRAVVESPDPRTIPGAVAVAIGLPVFDGRLDPDRLFALAGAGDLDRLRGELGLYPLDAAWRGATLVALAWAEAFRNVHRARALRSEAAREIADTEPELQRLDELLASPGVAGSLSAHPPSETRILALLAQVGGTPFGEHVAEDLHHVGEELRVRQAGPPTTAEHVAEGVTARHATHAELFAREFVTFAAAHPDSGDTYLDEYIRRHALNSYREYRRSALLSILHAVLDHPDPEWIGDRLKAIVRAELSASNPEFTECAPAALASLRLPDGFDAYVDEARQAAANLPPNPERGEGDTWGSHKRRLGAAAEALARGRGDRQGAMDLLGEGLKLPYGFAGFQAPACLSLAESIRVVETGDGGMIDQALAAARTASHNIFERTFAMKMTSRCNAMIENWWPAPVDIADVIPRFATDPSRPEFAAMHIVGWEFEGRRPDAEAIPQELRRSGPTLADIAHAYGYPLGELRRLNPKLPRTEGLPDGERVFLPDPEFHPMLSARLAAEALAVLPDSNHQVMAIRKLLPIAADSVTMLDVVIARLIFAIAPLENGDALLEEIGPVLASWVPRLPKPKASARTLLSLMA